MRWVLVTVMTLSLTRAQRLALVLKGVSQPLQHFAKHAAQYLTAVSSLYKRPLENPTIDGCGYIRGMCFFIRTLSLSLSLSS